MPGNETDKAAEGIEITGNTVTGRRPSAIRTYFHTEPISGIVPVTAEDRATILEEGMKDAFNTMMEGVAMFLDLVGQLEYTYTTESGNKVHGILDSP